VVTSVERRYTLRDMVVNKVCDRSTQFDRLALQIVFGESYANGEAAVGSEKKCFIISQLFQHEMVLERGGSLKSLSPFMSGTRTTSTVLTPQARGGDRRFLSPTAAADRGADDRETTKPGKLFDDGLSNGDVRRDSHDIFYNNYAERFHVVHV